jgi:hypothetical protein
MNRLTILLIAGVAAAALGGCTSLLQSPQSRYVEPPKAQTYQAPVTTRPTVVRRTAPTRVSTPPTRETGGGPGGGNGGGGPGGGGWG